MAAERLESDSEMAALLSIQKEMDALGEPMSETFPDYLAMNDRFHAEVLRLAKNEALRHGLDRLYSLPLTSRLALVSLQTKFPEATEIFLIGRDQHLRLIEDECGLCLIAPAGGVCDERRRAHAKHLCRSEDDKRQVAADADRGDCRGAQTAHPVQIDENVQRLEDHADQHVTGRPEEMSRQRSCGEILHSRLSCGA